MRVLICAVILTNSDILHKQETLAILASLRSMNDFKENFSLTLEIRFAIKAVSFICKYTTSQSPASI